MTSAEIKTSQERLSDIIEYGIFKPLLIANDMDGVEVPQVIWNPLDERGETEVLNNFKIFADAADKLFKAGVYTGDEIKKIIGEQFPFVEKKK